jgi:hypothetical protein
MEVIRQDVERSRSRAVDEARKAARIVQAGAGRATAAIREEGGRAVSAMKKAVAAKASPGRKRGKETSDFQP